MYTSLSVALKVQQWYIRLHVYILLYGLCEIEAISNVDIIQQADKHLSDWIWLSLWIQYKPTS